MEKDTLEALLKKNEGEEWVRMAEKYEEVRNWLSNLPLSEEMVLSMAKHLHIFMKDAGIDPKEFLALPGPKARDLTEKKCEEYMSKGEHAKVTQVKYAVRSFYNYSHKADGERIYFTQRHKLPGCPG